MSVSKKLPTWADNASGSVAVMFTIALVLICGIAGGVVDITRAFNIRSKLQMAADAAVLAAANDPAISDGQAKQEARRYFHAALSDIPSSIKPSFDIKRVSTATSVDVTASTTAAVPTTLLSVMGFKKIVVTATASAGRGFSAVDIYAAVDMSASMGIAADAANRDKLKALTQPYYPFGGGCSFACHRPETTVPVPTTTADVAKSNGVRLREDVMKDAFGLFVDELMNPKDQAVKSGLRRMTTYGFSDNLQKLAPLSTFSQQIKDSLLLFPNASRVSTRLDVALAALTTEMGVNGDGSKTSPRKLLLLVTDGVRWDFPSWAGGVLDSSQCDTLKRNGITVAVLEIKYFEDTGGTEFESLVRPFYTAISPALQACASPGFYFHAEDSADVQLNKAFVDVARAMRPKLALSK